MWIEAETTEKTLRQAYSVMKESMRFYQKAMQAINTDLKDIGEKIPEIEEKNPGLMDEFKEGLLW